MNSVTTIIIGAGQAGLAMSHFLTQRSIDHLVLERGDVANSWRKERWDSLRLLTPNWQSRLPGFAYQGGDPNGYRSMPETVGFLSQYADAIAAPIKTNCTVMRVSAIEDGYKVETNIGIWTCRKLVLASGACNIASVPKMAASLPRHIQSTTPMAYKRPDDLDTAGVLVVGGSATGVQLAQELQRSGRQVTLAVGEHVRVPRRYRGRDIKYWMDASGVLDQGLGDIDDVRRVRNLPSMQLIGSPTGESIDLNSLQAEGVNIVGRAMDLHGSTMRFSGSLPNVCQLADLKMNRLLSSIDEWIAFTGAQAAPKSGDRPEPTRLPSTPSLELNLETAGIKTVLWATGYRADYSWLDLPVLDHKGRLRHHGGIVDAPGVYALGLPFLRRRNSTLIDGVGKDAAVLASHLANDLANGLRAA